MVVQNRKQAWTIHAGEAAFIRRDHRVSLTKQPADGKAFCGLFLHLDQPRLKKILSQIRVPGDTDGKVLSVVPIPSTPYLKDFFSALDKDFTEEFEPSAEEMDRRIKELVVYLIKENHALVPVLFDFYWMWKPSLESFMEENYREDLTISDFARYTGRSLSTFKRDFFDLYGETPARWITRRRLEEARRLLAEGRNASDIYMEVGFKNLSHFSTAFKKEFGQSPKSCTLS